MSEPIIEVRHLQKDFGSHTVLRDMNFTVREGDVTSIIGASGSGKSTLLRCINLLERPTSGEIFFHGMPISAHGTDACAYRAKVGMVFQSFNLFNNMTVLENCTIGPVKVLGRSKEDAREKAMHFLEKVGMAPYINAKPRQLSGGMKQRVAIARAYAVNPSLLLMDEPFGALDAQTRTQLQSELLKTWEEERKTCFFITHDVEEAIVLASKVVIMSARPGRIKEIVDIDIPYPRTQETKMLPRFTELKNYIWNMVYREYLEVQK